MDQFQLEQHENYRNYLARFIKNTGENPDEVTGLILMIMGNFVIDFGERLKEMKDETTTAASLLKMVIRELKITVLDLERSLLRAKEPGESQ